MLDRSRQVNVISRHKYEFTDYQEQLPDLQVKYPGISVNNAHCIYSTININHRLYVNINRMCTHYENKLKWKINFQLLFQNQWMKRWFHVNTPEKKMCKTNCRGLNLETKILVMYICVWVGSVILALDTISFVGKIQSSL